MFSSPRHRGQFQSLTSFTMSCKPKKISEGRPRRITTGLSTGTQSTSRHQTVDRPIRLSFKVTHLDNAATYHGLISKPVEGDDHSVTGPLSKASPIGFCEVDGVSIYWRENASDSFSTPTGAVVYHSDPPPPTPTPTCLWNMRSPGSRGISRANGASPSSELNPSP